MDWDTPPTSKDWMVPLILSVLAADIILMALVVVPALVHGCS